MVPTFHRTFTTINLNVDGGPFLLLFVYIYSLAFSFYLLLNGDNFSLLYPLFSAVVMRCLVFLSVFDIQG
jgi:hypothetical protein